MTIIDNNCKTNNKYSTRNITTLIITTRLNELPILIYILYIFKHII